MNLQTIIKSLKDHDVHFVIIGATAGVAHGLNRTTRDLDVFIEPSKDNITKLFSALQESGYDLQDTTIEEALTKKLLFRQYILELDIHPSVKGVSFEQVWQNKIEIDFAGEKVFFSSLDDLILMKQAAGRPKDLEDLAYLQKINRAKKS